MIHLDLKNSRTHYGSIPMVTAIKLIRMFTGCGLKEAKDRYDRAVGHSGSGEVILDEPQYTAPEMVQAHIDEAVRQGLIVTRDYVAPATPQYSLGELSEDYTSGSTYAREILDPQGRVICHVIEANGYDQPAKDLINHLNRS